MHRSERTSENVIQVHTLSRGLLYHDLDNHLSGRGERYAKGAGVELLDQSSWRRHRLELRTALAGSSYTVDGYLASLYRCSPEDLHQTPPLTFLASTSSHWSEHVCTLVCRRLQTRHLHLHVDQIRNHSDCRPWPVDRLCNSIAGSNVAHLHLKWVGQHMS